MIKTASLFVSSGVCSYMELSFSHTVLYVPLGLLQRMGNTSQAVDRWKTARLS
jgi:hypothetical protein